MSDDHNTRWQSPEQAGWDRELRTRRMNAKNTPCVHCGDAAPEGKCPGCGTAELTSGREICQACGMTQAYRPAAARYAGLSHGQPGHMCILPRPAEMEAS